MHYSYRWIKELSGTKKSAEQLAKLLMTHAFEVEGIEKFSLGLDDVVIGKVVGLQQHPNADKLRVAEVEMGKNDVRTIVCGAPNIALDQKVAVVLPARNASDASSRNDAGGPGTTLPNGAEIKKVTIRGVESNGMICSAKELGLGNDHTGILVLPEDAPVGALFAKHFNLEDTIIEAKILPDRGSDALAYQGFAREIAALDGHAPRLVEKPKKTPRIPSYNRAPKVIIAEKKGCPRYMGLFYKNVSIGESPLSLKAKLLVSGLRPINNIVDATNYLMLLTGQPMHAFDADKIVGPVTVRLAKKNEKLKILNGETLKLSPDDLVIADSKKALALAGVMGGLDSSVTEKTKNIFLEIANFNGSVVRRTKNRHNLPTDASYRFERNLDVNLPSEALREAIDIMGQVSGGKLMGMRDVYPKKSLPWKIFLSLDRVEHVLGEKLPLFQVVQCLALLGLSVKKVADQGVLTVTVPTRRPDLRDEWDLIEEIGRMHGYDKIAATAPLLPLATAERNEARRFERSVKEYLASAGFDELMTYSFYGEKEIRGTRLVLEHHLELENPLSPDQKYLRMSLAPLLLRKVGENMRHFDSFDVFEWGSVFAKNAIRQLAEKEPVEVKSLELITVLPKKGTAGEAFYTIKGKTEAFLVAMHIDTESISYELPEKFPDLPVLRYLHPTRSVCLVAHGKPIGIMGEFHPEVLKSFGLEQRLAMAGFVAEELQSLQNKEILFRPIQKFPYALRDISLVFPQKTTVSDVERLLYEAGAPLLQRSELFDIYEQGEEKSFAFHLSFGAPDRTLSSTEMDASFDRIVLLAGERHGGKLRK